MKHFFIITNETKDKDLKVTEEIRNYVQQKGGHCKVYAGPEEGKLDPSILDADTECMIVLGGDGTLIRAARDMAKTHIPLIGVNLGTLGFLCELERSTVLDAIDQLIMDRYVTESRILLCGYSVQGGMEDQASLACMDSPQEALNDIVIHRTDSSQIVNLILYVNGEYLNSYNADGMIIATPTGSTGYNFSAGGPIVDPNADLLLITPLNPHAMNNKCIVVSGDAEIVVEIGERKAARDEEAKVTFDGGNAVTLHVGDKIVMKKSSEGATILKLNQLSFLQNLRKKMQEYR